MRLLSVGPRIHDSERKLVASEPLRVRLASLGSYRKTVVVDRDSQTISIERRVGWFFLTRWQIQFHEVQAVTYGYCDLNRPTAADFSNTSDDSYDQFRVGLRLRDGSDIKLFDFEGNGEFQNDS